MTDATRADPQSRFPNAYSRAFVVFRRKRIPVIGVTGNQTGSNLIREWPRLQPGNQATRRERREAQTDARRATIPASWAGATSRRTPRPRRYSALGRHSYDGASSRAGWFRLDLGRRPSPATSRRAGATRTLGMLVGRRGAGGQSRAGSRSARTSPVQRSATPPCWRRWPTPSMRSAAAG